MYIVLDYFTYQELSFCFMSSSEFTLVFYVEFTVDRTLSELHYVLC